MQNKIPDNLKLDKKLRVNIDLTEDDKNNIVKFLEENEDKFIRLSQIRGGEVSWSGNDMTYVQGYEFLSYATTKSN